VAEPLLLAIDQGTGSTKCLLVGSDGRVVSRFAIPVTIDFPEPGWVEQSPDDIWTSVVEGVSACLRGHDSKQVVAVGLSNQRESVLLWERASGRPLGPILGWQDQRTSAECERLLSAGLGATVRQLSGLPLDPMFSASKAGWLLDLYDPDRRRSASGELCLGTIDSWLMWRLVGRHCIELGNASRTQLLDVRTRSWSQELLEIFRVPVDVLPSIVPSSAALGHVRDFPGLPPDVPLTAVLADSHAALFAHGAFEPGLVKATYGTGSSVMGLVDAHRDVGLGVGLTLAWDTGEPAYAAEANIRASGATIIWLAALLGTTPGHVFELAVSTGSDGVILVPAFGGLAAPWWDDSAQATLTGLTLGTGAGQVARAAVESIALQVNDVVAAMEQGVGRVQGLLADGGGSASDTLMQLQADITQLPVYRARDQDLSALGAAHLAGIGGGVWSIDDLRGLPRERDTFIPRLDGESAAARVGAWHSAVERARYSHPMNPGRRDPR